MKKIICLLLSSLFCIGMGTGLLGCTGSPATENTELPSEQPEENTPSVSPLTQQVNDAVKLYNDIYGASERKGGMFTEAASTNNVAVKTVLTADTETTPLQTVRDIMKSYGDDYSNFANWAASYVGDIFCYSQIQLSIIGEYSEEALAGNFIMDYSEVDWTVFNKPAFGMATWFTSVHSDTASFPGVDSETGRVYCTETHVTSRKLNAETDIEYYYNSDTDMGVTTLNWQTNPQTGAKSFEYNFFDIGADMVLVGNFSVSGDTLTPTDIRGYYPGKTVFDDHLTESEKQIVYQFMLNEIERISGKTTELAELNAERAEEENITVPDEARNVKVKLDPEVLKRMLGITG